MTAQLGFVYLLEPESAKLRWMPRGFYLLNPRNVKTITPIDSRSCRIEYVERKDRFVVPRVLVAGANTEFVVPIFNGCDKDEQVHRTFTLVDNNGVSAVKTITIDKIAGFYTPNADGQGWFWMWIEENGSMKFYKLQATWTALMNVFDTAYVEDGTPYVFFPYATLAPTTSRFDVNGNDAVGATITWQAATAIGGIRDISDPLNPVELVLNQDYSVNGDTLLITNSYLLSVLSQADETATFFVSFNDGGSATLVVTAVEFVDVQPRLADWDINEPVNVPLTITWNGALSVDHIVNENDSTDLTVNVDYTVVGNTLTFTGAYIATYLLAATDIVEFTIHFDDLVSRSVTFTGVELATITPEAQDYDISAAADMDFTVDFESATVIGSIWDETNGAPLVVNVDYSLAVNTLTIEVAYLAAAIVNPADEVELTVTFDDGAVRTLVITGIA